MILFNPQRTGLLDKLNALLNEWRRRLDRSSKCRSRLSICNSLGCGLIGYSSGVGISATIGGFPIGATALIAGGCTLLYAVHQRIALSDQVQSLKDDMIAIREGLEQEAARRANQRADIRT